MPSESNWDPETDAGYALAIAPLMREIADYVQSKLPPGTDFGVLVFAPPDDSKEEGRVLAVCTNRDRMAMYALQWIQTVIPPPKRMNR